MPYYSISTQSRELIRGKIKYVVATKKKDCMFFFWQTESDEKAKKNWTWRWEKQLRCHFFDGIWFSVINECGKRSILPIIFLFF